MEKEFERCRKRRRVVEVGRRGGKVQFSIYVFESKGRRERGRGGGGGGGRERESTSRN